MDPMTLHLQQRFGLSFFARDGRTQEDANKSYRQQPTDNLFSGVLPDASVTPQRG